jgi:LysM repeat protein
MKLLQIFGSVVAVHVIAFIFIFASPGCQSGPRTIPTPDATAPTSQAVDPVTFNAPTPVDNGPSYPGYNQPNNSTYAAPTRPGSPNAAAIAPAPKPVVEVDPVSTYTVARGDSLWSIAKKHGMTVSELARTNNLSTSATLKPGKKLMVPGKSSSAQDLATNSSADLTTVSADKAAAPRANGEEIRHTVMPGESLGVIARRYGVTTGALAAENNITNPALVRAGQHLKIPGSRAAARPTSTATTPATTPKSNGVPLTTPVTTPTPAPVNTFEAPAQANDLNRFEIAPPPPGQDLDAGLKELSEEVPTIRVEVPAAQPPKK